MSPIRVVVADDHVMFRQGLRLIIESQSGFEVIGEADDGLELLNLLKSTTPDLVVLDISMPRLRGIETIHEIKASHPKMSILMLTMHGETEFVAEAIAAGARGYLLKQDTDEQLFLALEKIRQDGFFLSPRLSDKMIDDWADACRQNRSPARQIERLTIREREILKLTAEGKSCKEIADLLFISSRTVEHHRSNILAKLNLRRTTDLIRYAICNRYVEV